MNNPILSIVIANYNYGRFLEDAIKSVLMQNADDEVELIICDAASTDNSVDVIKKYEKYISWWCSEKDGGQSAAFNKGFRHAKGRFLTWLNADDVMFPNAFSKFRRAAECNPNVEWFIGGCCWLDPELRVIRCTRGRPLSRVRADGGNIQAYGPSSFFSRALFERVGGMVDERFHYMMDIELWNRFYHKGGASYKILSGYIWGFRMHPKAKTSGQRFADSDMARADNPAWEKKRKEAELNASMYCKHRMTLLRRIISISPIPLLMGLVDTWRLKERPFPA